MIGFCYGEVDRDSAKAFREALFEAVDGTDDPLIIVDLSAISFVGTAGYEELMEVAAYAFTRDQQLIVCNPAAQCVHLFPVDEESGFRSLDGRAPA